MCASLQANIVDDTRGFFFLHTMKQTGVFRSARARLYIKYFFTMRWAECNRKYIGELTTPWDLCSWCKLVVEWAHIWHREKNGFCCDLLHMLWFFFMTSSLLKYALVRGGVCGEGEKIVFILLPLRAGVIFYYFKWNLIKYYNKDKYRKTFIFWNRKVSPHTKL